MMRPTIIVAAYSRPRALARLLSSVDRAIYPVQGPQLIISLDGGADPAVEAIARGFHFRHGPCEVITREKNMGLREHLLWCGEQARHHGSAIVLEDDLVVDPHFYRFACAAVEEYDSSPEIAGIALYSPEYNEFSLLPFEPLATGYSTFFAQVPCSSGQVWTAKQWDRFRHWYGSIAPEDLKGLRTLPRVTASWPQSSWKKIYAAYLIESDRYFVYPYRSYTTNCSDAGGAHIDEGTTIHQVSMGWPERLAEDFTFLGFDSKRFYYDAHFEINAAFLESVLDVERDSLWVDLYGVKNEPEGGDWSLCLTSRPVKEAIGTFPLEYHPVELNMLYPTGETDGFFSLAERSNVEFSRGADYACWVKYFSRSQVGSRKFLLPALRDYGRGYMRRLLRRRK